MKTPVRFASPKFIYALIVAVLMGAWVRSAPSVSAQADYPGAALFSWTCRSDSIIFLLQGVPVLQAGFAQIAGPLTLAVATQQNQPIVPGNPASLWALKSNELQIHLNSDPDGTKLVLSPAICGPLPVIGNPASGSAFSGQAMAIAQVNGPGQAVAFAQVTDSGQTMAFAQSTGSGQAMAFARSIRSPSFSGRAFHIVQKGENLFRIALRYGTTVRVLVAINNISDPSLIYVGQVIYLP